MNTRKENFQTSREATWDGNLHSSCLGLSARRGCEEGHCALRIEFTQVMNGPMPTSEGTHDSVYLRCSACLRHSWLISEQGQFLFEGWSEMEKIEWKWISFHINVSSLFFSISSSVRIWFCVLILWNSTHSNSSSIVGATHSDSNAVYYVLWTRHVIECFVWTDSFNPHTSSMRKILVYSRHKEPSQIHTAGTWRGWWNSGWGVHSRAVRSHARWWLIIERCLEHEKQRRHKEN